MVLVRRSKDGERRGNKQSRSHCQRRFLGLAVITPGGDMEEEHQPAPFQSRAHNATQHSLTQVSNTVGLKAWFL